MFYATKQNKYIVEGTSFELDGVQYPAVWLNQATAEQKAALGLQEVIATDSPKDDRFYWVSEQLNGAELTYINTPKQLDDSEDLFFLPQRFFSIHLPVVYHVAVTETSFAAPIELKEAVVYDRCQ